MDSARKRKASNATDGSASKKIKLLVRILLFLLRSLRPILLGIAACVAWCVGETHYMFLEGVCCGDGEGRGKCKRARMTMNPAYLSLTSEHTPPLPPPALRTFNSSSLPANMICSPPELRRCTQVQRARGRVQDCEPTQECCRQTVSLLPINGIRCTQY